MEKARLTREAAAALNKLYEDGFKPEVIVARHANVEWLWESGHLNELNLDQICRAVYVGVEVIEEEQIVTVTEQTRKDILELFDAKSGSNEFEKGFELGVARVLQLTGITVKGINE